MQRWSANFIAHSRRPLEVQSSVRVFSNSNYITLLCASNKTKTNAKYHILCVQLRARFADMSLSTTCNTHADISLPASALEELTRDGRELHSPLTFEVRVGRSKCYVGVVDFNAAEGEVHIPPSLARALNISETGGGDVLVKYLPLPKATFLRLRPLTSDFASDIADHRSALESAISTSYTALHTGQLVSLRHGGKEYSVLVAEVQPAAPACVVKNTDVTVVLEYDAHPSLGEHGSTSATTANQAASASSSPSQPLRLQLDGEPSVVQITAGQSAAYLIAAIPYEMLGGSSGGVPELEVFRKMDSSGSAAGGRDSGIEVYLDIGRPGPAYPTLTRHLWASNRSAAIETRDKHVVSVRRIRLDSASLDLPPGVLKSIELSHTHVDGAGSMPPAASLSLRSAVQAAIQPAVLPWLHGGDASGGRPPPMIDVKITVSRPHGVTTQQSQSSSSSSSSSLEHMIDDDTRDDRVELSIALRTVPGSRSTAPASSSSSTASGSTADGTAVECPTCKSRVPLASLTLHSAVCARNNVRCSFPECGAVLRQGGAAAEHVHCTSCGEVVPPVDAAKHARLYHAPCSCDACAASFKDAMAARLHCANECPLRIIVCRYCGAHEAAGPAPADYGDRLRGLSGHESYCSSRTVACGVCRAGVRLKDYESHFKVAHVGLVVSPPDMGLATRAERRARTSSSPLAGTTAPAQWTCPACAHVNAAGGRSCELCTLSWTAAASTATSTMSASSSRAPSPVEAALQVQKTKHCANAACGRPASKFGDASMMSLCSRCFAAFGMDASDTDALDTELLLRYTRQLEAGCGDPRCRNRACKTGKANLGLPRDTAWGTVGDEVAALLLEAHPPRVSDARYYVCVSSALDSPASSPSLSAVAPLLSSVADLPQLSVAAAAGGGGLPPRGIGAPPGGVSGAAAAAAAAKRKGPSASSRVASAFF